MSLSNFSGHYTAVNNDSAKFNFTPSHFEHGPCEDYGQKECFERPVVIYGAGENSKQIISGLKNEYNLKAFSDYNLQKQGKQYLGLPVKSLQQVLSEYPDCLFYISTARPLKYEIINEVLLPAGVIKDRIINYEYAERRLGCEFIEKGMKVNENGLTFCCFYYSHIGTFDRDSDDAVNMFGVAGDPMNPKVIEDFIKIREQRIQDIIFGHFNPCENCEHIRNKYYTKNEDYRIDNIGFGFFSEPCHFSCVYCTDRLTARKLSASKKSIWQNFNYEIFVDTLNKYNLLSKDLHLGFASGEVTISPHRNEIYEVCKRNATTAFFSTTGLIFDESLFRLSNSGGMNISIDSGTPSTFKAIKGVDKFDSVVETIAKYSESPKFTLKYIFLERNSNFDDVDGFVKVCVACSVKRVTLSGDYRWRDSNIPDCILPFIKYMYVQLLKNGIAHISFEYFTDEQRMSIIATKAT